MILSSAFAIGLLAASPVVIAGPPGGVDQPASPDAAAALRFVSLGLAGIGLIVLAGFLYKVTRRPRWLERTSRAPSLDPLGGFIVLWVALLVPILRIGAARVVGFDPGDDPDIRSLAIGFWLSYGVSLATVIAWLVVKRRSRRGLESFGATVEKPPASLSRAAAVGIIAFLLAFPTLQFVGLVANYVQYSITSEVVDPIGHKTLASLSGQPFDLWALLVALAVIVAAPLIEETIYRGTVQAVIRGSGASGWIAILFAAALFAAMHWSSVPAESRGPGLVQLFALGVILGLAYERTGRLLTPIVIHGLFNLTELSLFYAFRDVIAG
ncbi:MAG: CPBP family intramembrane glutamic endopeptidase [Phycisphaerales bacterium]